MHTHTNVCAERGERVGPRIIVMSATLDTHKFIDFFKVCFEGHLGFQAW